MSVCGWHDRATCSETDGERREAHVAGSAGFPSEGTTADFIFFFSISEFPVEVLLTHLEVYLKKKKMGWFKPRAIVSDL